MSFVEKFVHGYELSLWFVVHLCNVSLEILYIFWFFASLYEAHCTKSEALCIGKILQFVSLYIYMKLWKVCIFISMIIFIRSL